MTFAETVCNVKPCFYLLTKLLFFLQQTNRKSDNTMNAFSCLQNTGSPLGDYIICSIFIRTPCPLRVHSLSASMQIGRWKGRINIFNPYGAWITVHSYSTTNELSRSELFAVLT